MSVFNSILKKIAEKKKLFVVLLDPQECVGELCHRIIEILKETPPDYIFIGGSSVTASTEALIDKLSSIPIPKILFPGDATQFTPKADALLFLSLISGDNPEYLTGQHIRMARKIARSNIEVIPTAYLLIGENNASAVERVSHTHPLPTNAIDTIVSTALAGELLGMKLVYLEAGSGAKKRVPTDVVRTVAEEISSPLIVGGGVQQVEEVQELFEAGADMVVVGNHFEHHPNEIPYFVAMPKS